MLTFLRAPRSSLPGFSRQSIEEIHFAKIDGYPYQVRARRTWRLCELNVRHDRFARDHFRREPYPVMRGRVRTWTWPRRGPARSRVPANRHCVQRKRFGRQLACGAQATRHGRMWRRDMRLPSDSKFGTKKPAADFSVRAL
jgi:hypothetical protein